MNMDNFSPLVRQLYTISAIFSTIFSCGLGLGLFNVLADKTILKDDNWNVNVHASCVLGITGEIAFVPSVIIIPYIMQRKGRRKASLATILPIFIAWTLIFTSTSLTLLIIFNVFLIISIGGAIAISSVIISEYTAPKFRSSILMFEIVVLSLGIFVSNLCGVHGYLQIVPYVGIISASYAAIVTHYWKESPYWLINEGYMERSTENFYWLRGMNEEARKEMNTLLMIYKAKIQVDALKPILKRSFYARIMKYIKTLWRTDFLRPLSIMISLFTFVVFAESLSKYFSFKDLFNSPEEYNGAIIIGIITVLCSVTACVLLRFERRKTLFMITSSISVLFLFLAGIYLRLQTFGALSPKYVWLYAVFGTLFVMFMSLSTIALPFSLLGEIFPMPYKSVGSSLACIYLWVFRNIVLRFGPLLSTVIGKHGMIIIIALLMTILLIVVKKMLPETHGKSLVEIEAYNISDEKRTVVYNSIKNNKDDVESVDKLNILIE